MTKSTDLFFKEYLFNNDEPILLQDENKIKNVVEYLLYNLENMPEDINEGRKSPLPQNKIYINQNKKKSRFQVGNSE